MKTQKLSIPEPCNVGWKNMQDAENGKFCHLCNKVIPDLSKLPDFQIRSIIEQAEGEVCGRISLRQLNRIRLNLAVENHSNTKENFAFLKVAVLTGTMLSSLSFAASNPHHIQFSNLSSIDVNAIVQEANTVLSDIEISGTVIDQLNKEPIAFAIVKLEIEGKTYAATTDFYGKFKLMLPETLLGSVVVLSVHSIDYETKTVNVSLSKNRVYKEIEMKADENRLIEGIIIREDD